MAAFYNIMFYGGLTLAIIFAVIAIVLFFVLKIPKAVGEVTGSTAKKKIEEIREKGYESVQGAGVSKKDAIKSHSTKISVRDVNSSATKDALKKGRANYEKAVAELHSRNEASGEEATDVLREDDSDVTDNLKSSGYHPAQTVSLKMIMDVVVTHSEESI